jgi:uncharacterized membrane protein
MNNLMNHLLAYACSIGHIIGAAAAKNGTEKAAEGAAGEVGNKVESQRTVTVDFTAEQVLDVAPVQVIDVESVEVDPELDALLEIE